MEAWHTSSDRSEKTINLRKWFLGLTLVLGLFVYMVSYSIGRNSSRSVPHLRSVFKPKLKLLAETTSRLKLLTDKNLPSDQSALSTQWSPYMDIIDEKTALQNPPITDIKKSVDVSRSKVYLIDPRRPYVIGDTVRVRIDLYDGYAQPRRTGGDQLRVRIFEKALDASASGYILDHKNGSYTAIVKCLWTGKPTILLYISYTREAVRALYHIRKTLTATRSTYARYANMELRECHAFSTRLDQSSPKCNMTSLNGNMSWFCLASSDGSSCTGFKHFELKYPFPNLPITDVEERLFKRNGEHLTPTININISKRSILPDKKETKPPCFSYNRTQLWFLPSPVGHFMHNKWETEHCKMTPSNKFPQCLRNKHILFYGDSTIRQWFEEIFKRYNCKMITEKWTQEKWKKDSAAYCPSMNLTIEWVVHSFPGNIDKTRLKINSIAENMLKFKNNTDTIFVIHLLCHLSAYHHSVYRDRISHIRKSVDTVLKYNKNAKILIKGGHTFADFRQVSDYYGYVYRTITIEEFKGLYDKVVYLDNKDMTIAKEVKPNHPENSVVSEMVDQMLSYICS